MKPTAAGDVWRDDTTGTSVAVSIGHGASDYVRPPGVKWVVVNTVTGAVAVVDELPAHRWVQQGDKPDSAARFKPYPPPADLPHI
jgi:hypothetical protein